MKRTAYTVAGAMLVIATMTPAATAAADDERIPSGRNTAFAVTQNGSPDFLFGRPSGAVGVRFQWTRLRGDSDLFSFLTEQLTLSTRDFDGPGLAVDIAFPVTSRLDGVAGLSVARANALSEDRRFVELVDGERRPIEQESKLTQVDISGSLEWALTPRGREIGQFAWITAPVTPYVGAGAGLQWYRFEQQGDFVESFEEPVDGARSIFSAQLRSDGWTVSTHVLVGVDVKIARQWQASAEARYLWADATMSEDFLGFEPIDLSGIRITGGIQYLF